MPKIVPEKSPMDALGKKFELLKSSVPTLSESFEIYAYDSFLADKGKVVTKISSESKQAIAGKSLIELDRALKKMSDENKTDVLSKVLSEVKAEVFSPEQKAEAEEIIKNFRSYFFDEMRVVKDVLDLKKSQQHQQQSEQNNVGFVQKILRAIGISTQKYKVDVTESADFNFREEDLEDQSVIIHANNSRHKKPDAFSGKPVSFDVDKKNRIVRKKGKRDGFSPSPAISPIPEGESSEKEQGETVPASGDKSPDPEMAGSATPLQSPREDKTRT